MSKCELCGEPMPAGEEMFKFHGFSGDCPKPPRRGLAPHQQRVVEERDQLAERFAKLGKFIDEGMVFCTLPLGERRRLEDQAAVMDEYLAILNERIAAFETPLA